MSRNVDLSCLPTSQIVAIRNLLKSTNTIPMDSRRNQLLDELEVFIREEVPHDNSLVVVSQQKFAPLIWPGTTIGTLSREEIYDDVR